MNYSLDSALVITLRKAIRWESAIISDSGTLATAGLTNQFNPKVYQDRDRALAYRDLLVAGAIVEASIQVSDVFNADIERPSLDGPVTQEFPLDAATMPVARTNLSQVRHVVNSSVPYDAIRYTDADLYGRDCLVYETLARACALVFEADSPVPQVDSGSTYIASNGTYAWSLAEGAVQRADINSALKLNKDLFKKPDQNLAERDNQLAAYTARIVRALKNPFEYAHRLYVEVTGPESRELEVYTLSVDNDSERIWTCEPALSNRNRITYSVPDKTLQWARDSFLDVHLPQIIALSIPGILPGQQLKVRAQVPAEQDCQYWRAKAGQIRLPGTEQSEAKAMVARTDNGEASGGYHTEDGQALTVPGSMTLYTEGTLPAGRVTATILAEPSLSLTINGGVNVSSTEGMVGYGGATFQHNIQPSDHAILAGVEYYVVNGDGITYNGVTYTARQSFTGVIGVTDFAQAGAVASEVRQYKLLYKLALPTGPWKAKLTYTDATANQGGFALKAHYAPPGVEPTVALSDAFSLPVPPSHLATYESDWGYFDAYDTSEFDFPIYWTSGTGAPHIRKLTFEPGADIFESGAYALTAEYQGTSAEADFTAEVGLPFCAQFDFDASAAIDPTLKLSWLDSGTANLTDTSRIPLVVKQMAFHSETAGTETPLAEGFSNWKEQCLVRALGGVQKNYMQYVAACLASGTEVPEVRSAGAYWDATAVTYWNSLVETVNPRLREQAGISSIVAGRQYEALSSVTYAGTVYTEGDKFYGVSGTTTFSPADSVLQVGAFVSASPAFVGRPALVPKGMVYAASGTVYGDLSTADSLPVITACQPWMIDLGVLVSGPEFWSTENI